MPTKSHPAALGHWTVMIYMAADNDLIGAAWTDLEEMVRGLSQADNLSGIQVVAMVDFPSETETPTVIYDLTPEKEVIDDMPNIPADDPGPLGNFLSWCVENRPAEHYGLVVWGHGDGVDWTYRTQELASIAKVDKGIAIDSNFLFLPIRKLRKALEGFRSKAQKKLDFVGFDACMMGMLEINQEVCEAAEFVVSSPTVMPEDGWPYDEIFRQLGNSPQTAPKKLADLVVSAVAQYYQEDGKHPPPYSTAFDLSASPAMADAIKTLAESLRGITDKPAITQARDRAAVYRIPEYIDIQAFCCEVEKELPATEAARAAHGVRRVLREQGYLSSPVSASGPSETLPTGPAIFFPTKKGLSFQWRRGNEEITMTFNWEAYSRLSFCKKTKWDLFLNGFVEKGEVIHGISLPQESKGEKTMAKGSDKLNEMIKRLRELRKELTKFPPDSTKFPPDSAKFQQLKEQIAELMKQIDRFVRNEIKEAAKKRKKNG